MMTMAGCLDDVSKTDPCENSDGKVYALLSYDPHSTEQFEDMTEYASGVCSAQSPYCMRNDKQNQPLTKVFCSACTSYGMVKCSINGTKECIDVLDNRDHCGSCGHACESYETCERGECLGLENGQKCNDSVQCQSKKCENQRCVMLDLNEPCQRDKDCDSGKCEGSDGNKKCVGSLKSDGAVCSDHKECESNYCADHKGARTCFTRLNNGESCDQSEDCISGYCNSSNQCANAPKANGESCEKAEDCISGYCNSLNQCADAPKANGETCKNDAECISNFCSPLSKCSDAKKYNGESCAKAGDCLSNYCNSLNQCADAPKANGETCKNDAECISNFCSPLSKCSDAKKEIGQTCSRNEECESGNCETIDGEIYKCALKENGQNCALGEECKSGYCNSSCYEYNSCANPYELTIGATISGNTMTGNSYQTGDCGSKGMNAMMAVTHTAVSSAGFYEISATANGASGWGTMLATDCNPLTSVVNSCAIEGGSDSYYAFLESGDYYSFVAPHVTSSPHFDFTASISKADEKAAGLCSYSKYKYHIVNFHAGADGLQQNETIDNSTPGTYIYTITDSTKDGNTSDVWSSNSSKLSCKVLTPTAGGKDRSYLVYVPANSKLTAHLEYMFSSDKSNEAAIYMKRCDDKTNYSKVMSTLYACDDSKNDRVVIFNTEPEEGVYILIVDTENSNSYIDYKLQLTLKMN